VKRDLEGSLVEARSVEAVAWYDDVGRHLMARAKGAGDIVRHAHLRSPRAERSLMGMPHATNRWTVERVRALPDDGNRYELIDGALVVTPAPRGLHQEAIMGLVTRLHPWLLETGIGRVLCSPADISLGDEEILQPDLFVYRTATGARLRDWSDIIELRLVVEVLSPATARYDRQLKRRRYQRARIAEYWIVDVDARLIERWRPDDDRPEMASDRLVWAADPNQRAFELDVPAYFADVLESKE